MEDLRHQIANYLEIMGFNKTDFLQDPNNEEVEIFFMGCQGCESGVDADHAHCLECGEYHPDHYEQDEEEQKEFGRMQAIYNDFMTVFPQYEQERLAAEKAEQERLAAEKAEQERLACEKAERERARVATAIVAKKSTPIKKRALMKSLRRGFGINQRRKRRCEKKTYGRKAKKTRKGRANIKTWIIKVTPNAVSTFENKIFNSGAYRSTEDDDAEAIMSYLKEESMNVQPSGRWFVMVYEDGFWYPSSPEVDESNSNYRNALKECKGTCFKIQNENILPILRGRAARSGKRKTNKKRRYSREKRRSKKRRV